MLYRLPFLPLGSVMHVTSKLFTLGTHPMGKDPDPPNATL